MQAPAAPPVTPWHRRVLDWLGVEPVEDGTPQGLPQPDHRFPWEPPPPAPRPPQWGAANQPELLLGQDGSEDALRKPVAAGLDGLAAQPQPNP